MKRSIHFFNLCSLFALFSCSTKPFVTENICSPNAISYMKKSKGRSFIPPKVIALEERLAATQPGMQQCYQNYLKRTGHEEFQTCMVVGVDAKGKMEYFNFSSQDIHSDRAFLQCAAKVTRKIPYQKYGKNYILVHSYNFH